MVFDDLYETNQIAPSGIFKTNNWVNPSSLNYQINVLSKPQLIGDHFRKNPLSE